MKRDPKDNSHCFSHISFSVVFLLSAPPLLSCAAVSPQILHTPPLYLQPERLSLPWPLSPSLSPTFSLPPSSSPLCLQEVPSLPLLSPFPQLFLSLHLSSPHLLSPTLSSSLLLFLSPPSSLCSLPPRLPPPPAHYHVNCLNLWSCVSPPPASSVLCPGSASASQKQRNLSGRTGLNSDTRRKKGWGKPDNYRIRRFS